MPEPRQSDRSPEVSAAVWALVCASGEIHREGGKVPTGVTRECAEGAAEFMDEAREPGIGWTCGPHRVVPHD